jgi:flagellar assembly protein FliH
MARTVRRRQDCAVSRWAPQEAGVVGAVGEQADVAPQEEQRGYDDGYARGLEEGRSAGEASLRAEAGRLAQICRSAQRPLAELDELVEDELCRLSLCIARQVVRRELHGDADQVAGLIREARKVMGDIDGPLRISVHPEDAVLVRRMFADDESVSTVVVEDDPTISRGGCTLATNVSFVDATVETRIARLAVQLLGDERELDAPAARSRAGVDDAASGGDAAPESFDMVLS